MIDVGGTSALRGTTSRQLILDGVGKQVKNQVEQGSKQHMSMVFRLQFLPLDACLALSDSFGTQGGAMIKV